MNAAARYLQPRKRLLMVEDEPIVQKIQRMMLEAMGFYVDIAKDGHEALALFAKGYDFILMDVGLPDTCGIEVVKQIRQQEAGEKRIPIIGVTAYIQEEILTECRKSGMDAVFVKPIKRAELERFFDARL